LRFKIARNTAKYPPIPNTPNFVPKAREIPARQNHQSSNPDISTRKNEQTGKQQKTQLRKQPSKKYLVRENSLELR